MVNDHPDDGNSIGTPGASANYEIREIDLAGKIINSIPMSSVNQSLAAIASFQLASFHHDFALLPNGHLIRGRRAPWQITFGGLTIGAELDWAIINTLMRAISEQMEHIRPATFA